MTGGHCLLQVSKELEARAAASAAALLAEEERAKAKAAAKKAKKQKQKGKKQQAPAAAAATAAAPDELSSSVAEADTEAPAAHESAAAGHAGGVSQKVATPADLQQQMQQLSVAPAQSATDFNDAFLTNLFRCPLTKVRPAYCIDAG